MTTYYDAEGNEVEVEVDETQALRDARAAADSNAGAAKNAKKLERENAFLKAGLTDEVLETPVGKMFAKTYEGEFTKEAVAAAAAEVGLVKVAAEPLTPDELALQETREAMRTGSAPPASEAAILAQQEALKDPTAEGLRVFKERMEVDGLPREIASAEFFDRVVSAGAAGDERVTWTPQKHLEKARQAGVVA